LRSDYSVGVEPLLVIYDADCGVCQASVEWLRNRDRRALFHFVGNEGELPAAVSREETEHTLVVIDGGRKLTRSAAMARIFDEVRGWTFVGRFLRLPGVSWVADRAYDRFARNRHRVSTALGLRSCPAPRRPPRNT
jgi:predicted DCC family thiol-disulfide oxidoreductase YuxK